LTLECHLHRAAATGLPTLADPAYDGADLDINALTCNALRSLGRLGELGFVLLTGRWRTLQHITASVSKISDIARSALVLTPFRIRLHRLKFAEITSLSLGSKE
jgi:uncharacterized membrane protein YccF (DUF307 family)